MAASNQTKNRSFLKKIKFPRILRVTRVKNASNVPILWVAKKYLDSNLTRSERQSEGGLDNGRLIPKLQMEIPPNKFAYIHHGDYHGIEGTYIIAYAYPQITEGEIPSFPNVEDGTDQYPVVREMFYAGMNSTENANRCGLHRSRSNSMQPRQELFEKQIEITKRYRGDANVRYAWLPTYKEALPTIMKMALGILDHQI